MNPSLTMKISNLFSSKENKKNKTEVKKSVKYDLHKIKKQEAKEYHHENVYPAQSA